MYDLENGKRLAEAARKALARTTEGPWVNNDQHSGLGWRVETDADGYPNDGWVVASELLGPDAEANARFIAYARSGVPALAADLELAHAEIERLREALGQIIELDHHNMGPESRATTLARKTLLGETP